MNPFVTCLWFDTQAEEAANFYLAVFKNGKMGDVARYTTEDPTHGKKIGDVLTAEFEVNGQKFLGLNGGPYFKFTEATSLQVLCDTQDEIDYYWDALQAGGGSPSQCGWLKDKFGFSWQVVSTALTRMLKGKDPARAGRVMAAMMKMTKLDVAALESAYAG